MRALVLAAAVFLLFSFRQDREKVKLLSLDYSSRILEKGKYISVSGSVYFRRDNGLLTTRLVKPFENVTVVNAAGEMKIYDPQSNTVVQNNSAFNSTETSYFWHFLNGSANDLGYSKSGYVISTSRVEQGLMITSWVPKAGYSTPVAAIELVHEKTLPIFVSFKNNRNQYLGKIFFSGYRMVGDLRLPMKITEIMYKGKADSTVTTKAYSNPQINAAVDQKYIDFRIPADAKIIPAN
jgi:hypothetical protein